MFCQKQRKDEEPHQYHHQHPIIKNLPDINNIINYNYNFAYPPGNPPYKDTDLKIRVIRHSQLLEGQDKFPDFDINEFVSNPYSHALRILKAGKEKDYNMDASQSVSA